MNKAETLKKIVSDKVKPPKSKAYEYPQAASATLDKPGNAGLPPILFKRIFPPPPV